MSFPRSVLLLIFASLFAAFGLLSFGYFSGYGRELFRGSEDTSFRGGYAILSTDAGINDSVLTELLEKGKENFSGPPVGESSQWVMLDDFGSLQAIPLEKYSSRVSSFDPRNDGYAEKLKNIFVRDGRRFVYIPLKSGSWAPASMNDQFTILLNGIPFSAEYFGFGKSVSLFPVFFIAYGLASLMLLVMCIIKRKKHPASLNALVLLPALSSLVFFGAGGIAACALLLGFFIMLREPLYEIIIRSGRHGFAGKPEYFFKNVIKPYLFCWFALPAFAAAMGLIILNSELKLFFVITVFFACGILFFLSFKAVSSPGGRHRRFIPVMIIKRRFADFAFSVYMLPFILAAFTALLMTSLMPGEMISNNGFDHIMDEHEYYAHLDFQASFSLRQLGSFPENNSGVSLYPGYIFDKDGLPSADIKHGSSAAVNIDDFPPFPLKHMMDFFNNVNSGNQAAPENRSAFSEPVVPDRRFVNFPRNAENPAFFILLFFLVPGFFIKKNSGIHSDIQYTGLRRFSGKPHIADINRKKVLKYNKNNVHIQRDTVSLWTRWRSKKDA